MLTISGKALGQKRPLFSDFSVPLPPELHGDDGVTLRQVIEHLVRDEVAAFKRRQREGRMLRVLTTREIVEGAEKGKIASGGSQIEPQEVDPDAAIGTALQAFEDGLYIVVVDGHQQRELDRQVFLQPESQITFVRLTLLAGG